jgi:hypothetical protein
MLERREQQYLMLVPRNTLVSALADQCRATKCWAVVQHTLNWAQDKTKHHVDTRLVLFPDEKYDWCWATNTRPYHISRLIHVYRIRWRIETMFRVQDEAKVKTKSRRGIVRYVTFLVSLLLTALWALARTGMTFKRWLVESARMLWFNMTVTAHTCSIP